MKLDSDFEDQLREAVLDEAEHELIGQHNGLVHQAIQRSREALEQFADQYDVEPILQSLEGPEVDRTDDSITIRWRFSHPAAGYFEFGTPDHYDIEGNPVLSFVWTDPPADAIPWLRENFEREGDGWRVFLPEVDSGEGIKETRFTRRGLRWLRNQLEEW
ncbi:hypothetical protein [Halorussus sp. AFM4]|uniref:hypothetical protein n=1 Tax=Halorussus sp. AFM4 TaxID=3421651 RepID=UPI003EB70D83